jgi:1-acyl-sn-glycerol-3-phosphate acyltransferase
MVKIKKTKVIVFTVIFLVIVKIILFKFIENYYKLDVYGIDKIPKKNGYVIISNHNFVLDVFIIKKIFKNGFNIVANKSRMAKILNYLTNIKVINYDKKKENIKKSGEEIKLLILKKCKYENENVVVFPEGKFSTPFELEKFKKGLFYLCYENNIPVLPMIYCVKNKEKIQNQNTLLSRYFKMGFYFCLDKNIKVKIFDVVYPNKFKDFNEYYNYIYNQMNNYIKEYIFDKKNKYNFFI